MGGDRRSARNDRPLRRHCRTCCRRPQTYETDGSPSVACQSHVTTPVARSMGPHRVHNNPAGVMIPAGGPDCQVRLLRRVGEGSGPFPPMAGLAAEVRFSISRPVGVRCRSQVEPPGSTASPATASRPRRHRCGPSPILSVTQPVAPISLFVARDVRPRWPRGLPTSRV
jgi:hypothetical protein